jgi:outer membrane autotransporter protein
MKNKGRLIVPPQCSFVCAALADGQRAPYRNARLPAAVPSRKLALALAILSIAVPMGVHAAPGDIASGGGRGGQGADASNGNGGAGGAGGIAGGGGGGGGGQTATPGVPTDGGAGGAGATLGGAAQSGSAGGNSGRPGGSGGLILSSDASSGGGGGGGAGGFSGDGGNGGDVLAFGSNVNAAANVSLSSPAFGANGWDGGSGADIAAGGGGGSGGSGGMVFTAPNATISTSGQPVAGGKGGVGFNTVAGGGGGGGGAGLVLAAGGTVDHDGAIILGGAGGDSGAGFTAGGDGGAGVFLVDGGALRNNAGSIQGGQGGAGFGRFAGNGGAGVLANRGSVLNSAQIVGGEGGTAGIGGAGGDAIVANGSTVINGAGAQITGGRGGTSSGFLAAGSAGAGIRFINAGGSLLNLGTVSGGAGGASSGGAVGSGGVAIVASGGVQLTNGGAIVGGMDGANAVRARAIELSGGANRLTLTGGSSIQGQVVSTSGSGAGGDILALGGDTTDGSTTFDVGQIGALGGSAQYQGFGAYQKTGASVWTLTGSNTGVTPWTLSAGALSIDTDGALGDVSGQLTFSGGVLRNTAAIDTARGVVVNAGGGAFETMQPLTLQGVVAGSGALAKTGPATLTLNGVNTYTGVLTVQAGRLVVGDGTHANALLPGTVMVGSGATLGGQGTVGSMVVAAGGIIAPGNSIGTLHVSGNLTLAPGSVYQVEVDSASSASDRIDVSGTATLAGSAVHVGPDGNFTTARDYTIVTAAGGVQGRFDNVASNYAFLDPQISYGAKDVTLRMQLKQVPDDGGTGNGGGNGSGNGNGNGNGGSGSGNGGENGNGGNGNGGNGNGGNNGAPGGGANGGPGGTRPIRFADAADTGNQRAVANAVQGLPQDNAVYARVLNLPQGAPPAAFDALSGEIHASAIAMLQGLGDTVASLPVAHLRTNLYADLAPGAPTAQRSAADMTMQDEAALPRAATQPVWAQVFGNWRTFGGNGSAARLKESDGGVFIGGDHAIGSGWRLGGAVGYTGSHASLKDRASTADVDSYSATVYAGKAYPAGPGRIEWTVGAAYTWHDVDTQRDTAAAGLGDTLEASYHASTAQVFTELGYHLPVGDGMALQPFAGVNYSDLRTRGFSESGGAAALDGQAQRNSVTATTLGLRGEARFESAGLPGRVHAMAGWRHAFGDLDPSTTMVMGDSVPFTVAGAPIAQDAAVMEIGVDMRVTKATTVGVAYTGQFGGGNRQNAGSVNVAWRF